MQDYKGAANHAEALAKFVDDVNDVIQDNASDESKVERVQALLSGPHGIKAASQVGQEDE